MPSPVLFRSFHLPAYTDTHRHTHRHTETYILKTWEEIMGGECGWDVNKQTDREINKKTINIFI